MAPPRNYPPDRRSGGSGEVRHQNLIRILTYVRDHGPSSRHDIARGCGLGVSTMTDLIGELRSRRLLREMGALPRPGAGRPTRPIALDGEPWCVLAVQVDVGGFHFSCSTVGGAELWREEIPAPLRRVNADTGFTLLRDAIRTQLRGIPPDKSLVALEVALPGYVASGRGVTGWPDSLGWGQMPLRSLLEAILYDAGYAGVSVGIEHDCRLAALHAVRVELALDPTKVAAYLGGLREIGGAVIIAGEIYHGSDGGAGDFGHLNVDARGPLCPCGRRGCLESLVGPARLLTSSGVLTAGEAVDVLARDPLPALRTLVERADLGEPRVLEVLAGAGHALGVALDDIISVLNPHVVVLGGYLGMLGQHLLGPVQERVDRPVSGESIRSTRVLVLEELAPRVLAGAVIAARDVCLTNPLDLTEVVLSA